MERSLFFPQRKVTSKFFDKIRIQWQPDAAYEASQAEIEKGIRDKCARLAPDITGQDRAEATWAIEKTARKSFRWQCFLSKGILKQHATKFVEAVAKSKLPFVWYEIARVADRKYPFVRRIFLTTLCDNRTRMNLEEFRLSKAYFSEHSSEKGATTTKFCECVLVC